MEDEEKEELITVACPCCENRRFSFSRNAVAGNDEINFRCSACGIYVTISSICACGKTSIFVQTDRY